MTTAFFQRVLRDPATRFGAALYFALALNLVQGVWLMRLLDPADFGRWIGLLLIFSYGQHFHLGIQNSLLRQLPLLRGRGDRDRARELVGAAHVSLLGLSLLWLVVGWLVAEFFYRDLRSLALAVVAITAFEAWAAVAVAELKTAERFGRVGALTVLRSMVNLGLLVLVARYGLHGAYMRWALLVLLMTALWWALNPVRAPWRFSRQDFRFLLNDGGPILLVGVLFSLQVSMDKTLIKALLDDAAMGRYGAAAILMTLMMVIPSSIGQTSYPRMLEAFGRGATPRELFGGVLRRCFWVGALSALVAVLGGLAMPTLLRWVLPTYLPGVHAAQWLLPGTVFLSASVPASYYLQTVRRQRLHALVSGAGVALQILLGAGALYRGGDIESLAITTSLSLLIYLALLFAAARWVSGRPGPQ
jgi:O-antigen/teichoic acid export membrane protein